MEDTDRRTLSERAIANWRRVRDFFAFLGRTDHDLRLLTLIARAAPGAPCVSLGRARLGHRQGAGRMRRASAQCLVGPFLGVEYGSGGRVRRLARCAGAVTQGWRERLIGLSDDALFALADQWVDYLCGQRSGPPDPGEGNPSIHSEPFLAVGDGVRQLEPSSSHA